MSTSIESDVTKVCKISHKGSKATCIHGRRSREGMGGQDRSTGKGDANANCPSQIFSYRYKKERPVALKIRQYPFSVGALPRTPLGSSRRSPRHPSRLQKGRTPHTSSPHAAPTHLRRSPCVPPEFQPDLRLCLHCTTVQSQGFFAGLF